MALPGADPAAAVKQIATEVKEKFDEAGMSKVEDFMDEMDDIADKAKAGAGALIKSAEDMIDAMTKKIEAALADPKSLVPGGGMAACTASCYSKSVQTRLKAFGDDTSALVEALKKVADNVTKPMQELAAGLEQAMGQLEGSVKTLAKLPKLINKELEGKDSPDDIAKINTAPMKKAIGKADLDGPLGILKGMKDLVGAAIDALKDGAETLEGFLKAAPSTVRHAFDMPGPLRLMQGIIMSKAPQLMKDLLDMIEKVKGMSLKPVMDRMNGTKASLGNLDVSAIKAPVEKFMESAEGLVGKLDGVVSGAKMASGGLTGAMAAVGNMFG